MIGISVAGMVCGILSLLVCVFGILLAIPGVVLSSIALGKKYSGKGMAIAGLACSSLSLVQIFFIILYIVLIGV